jgi:hypothetical protein
MTSAPAYQLFIKASAEDIWDSRPGPFSERSAAVHLRCSPLSFGNGL